MTTVLASFLSVTQNLGLPVLGLLVGIEALGVPLPGETAVIFAGLAANQGRLSIVAVIVVAASGAIIGDNIGFLIGRRGGRALLERPGRFAEERRRVLEIGDPFFERHGPRPSFSGAGSRGCASGPRGSRAPATCAGRRSWCGTRSAARPGRPVSRSPPTTAARASRRSSARSGSTAGSPRA